MKRLIPVLLFALALPRLSAAQQIVDIAFPAQGAVSFTDDYEDVRSNHTHHAIDILAAKMTPIVASLDGVIRFAPMQEPSYGYMLKLDADIGYSFAYIHINNDTPGTDDGMGGSVNAYASGIREGARVNRGQHIAWVGDSGNAESTASHLHFEMYDTDGAVINPFSSLQAAHAAITYDPDLELSLATSINVDKNIALAESAVACESDTLIRTPEINTVYYCGRDGGRYAFLDENTYFSWYADFDDVKFVSMDQMASIPLKGAVTYKPGSFMVKILSNPKVYAVSRNGTLRGIPSPDVAVELYGNNWAKQVRDIPDGFFARYRIGPEVTRN